MSRDARKEVGSPRRKKLSFFVPLPPPSAFSHARGHFCVSRLSLYGLRIKRDGSWSKVCVSNWARPVNWRLNDVSNFSIQGRAITCHQSLPLVDSAKSWSCGLLKGLIIQLKIAFCRFFHRILHLMVRFDCFILKSGFSQKNLVLCLTHSPLEILPKNAFWS